MKAKVNSDDCISCGLCVSECPEIFKFNEDEKAEAKDIEISQDILSKVENSRDNCPVAVIEIE